MSRYHPGYEQALRELYKNEGHNPQPSVWSNSLLHLAITVVFTSASVLGGLWLFSKKEPEIQFPSRELESIEGDLTTMKKILAGIVPAVRDLTLRNKEPVKQEASVTKLALVTASKALIRREPSLDSESIASVPSGNVLVVKEVEGDWISTFTPFGEPGWIHRSVVAME